MSISTTVGKWFWLDLHRNRTVIVRMTPRGERLEAVRFANDTSVLTKEMGKADRRRRWCSRRPAPGLGLSMCCTTPGAWLRLVHPLNAWPGSLAVPDIRG